jgi:hypothetical protein
VSDETWAQVRKHYDDDQPAALTARSVARDAPARSRDVRSHRLAQRTVMIAKDPFLT